jgi:lipoyl(octanoyl) transferase
LFPEQRHSDTIDELWILEHEPVFTLGQAGKPEHLLTTSQIPVVRTERGGQITYHGPGQIIVYVLLDLHRAKLTVKSLVCKLEQALINTLAHYKIAADRKAGAPGVYVAGEKIAALGLKVKKGATYHGLALNYAMDLTPFEQINACGYPGLKVTDMRQVLAAMEPRLGIGLPAQGAVQIELVRQLKIELGMSLT